MGDLPRHLQILKEDSWFLGFDGRQTQFAIRYEYVICYALLNYLQNHDFDKGLGLEALKNLAEHVNKATRVHVNNFLDLFPLQDNMGFVVVDRSGGIYPLMLYNDDIKREDIPTHPRERTYAFEKRLECVIGNYDVIFSFLDKKRLEDWDRDFQKQLFEAANFSNSI